MRRITLATGALAVGLATSLAVVTEAYVSYGKWATTSQIYYINPANQDVSATAAEAAVQAGASSWHQQSSANFQFSYGGRVNDTTTGYDQRNVVLFRNVSNGSTIATTYYWRVGTTVVDADIIFWDGGWTFFTGSTGCSSGAYIEDVAAHEFGHALGLSHTTVSGSTMYASYSKCSSQMRSLGADDIAGVEALYPASSANTAPTVTISAPSSTTTVAEGTSLTFAGSATDQQDGNLTNALSWTSSLEGPLGGGASFSRVLSAGTHSVTASVSDSGGLTAARQVTVTVTATTTNIAPSVTITSPSSGTTVSQGTAMSFTGSASDFEDGNISSSLVWSSSRDGQIGTGASFQRVLSTGTHTITAKATDSKGMSNQVQRSVTVEAPVSAANELSVTGRAYKVKGLQKVDLAWSGSAATSLDVYRNGVKIATTPNDGAYTDPINLRGSGSYTYKVCAATTTTCSTQITVIF
jgi:hypothetical protein